MSGVYERVKADLDYLQLGRAAECFAALADQAKREDWSHVDYLARVMAEQAAATIGRRLAARLRFARFPFRRTVEEFDFEFQPSIDRKLVADLATLRFIPEARPVLFLGQPGCGKTHLAVALAIKAVEAGYRGYFTTGDDLAATLTQARREGTFNTKLKSYTAPTVLVIDLTRPRDYPDDGGVVGPRGWAGRASSKGQGLGHRDNHRLSRKASRLSEGRKRAVRDGGDVVRASARSLTVMSAGLPP
jgi:DNA replication protein DnaC